MKQFKIIFAILLFSSFQSYAQTEHWIDKGSQWYFPYDTHTPPTYISYNRDTLIGNVVYELIEDEVGTHTITLTRNDSVFLFKDNKTTFMFSFLAQPKDEWNIDRCSIRAFTCVKKAIVDSVGVSYIAGKNRRWLALSYIGTSTGLVGSQKVGVGKIVEGIGYTEGIISPPFTNRHFGCFKWNDQLHSNDKGCTLETSIITSTDNNIVKKSFKAFPNPFDNNITIEIKEEATVRLLDSKSSIIYSGEGHQKYQIDDLQAGFYVLEVHYPSGKVERTKIIKQ